MKGVFTVLTGALLFGFTLTTANADSVGGYGRASGENPLTIVMGDSSSGALEWIPTKEMNFAKFDAQDSTNDVNSFAYCVQYERPASFSTVWYEYKTLDEFSDDYYKVAWLVDTYAPGNGSANTITEDYQSAALQALIWETLDNSVQYNAYHTWSLPGGAQINTNYFSYRDALESLTLTDKLRVDLESRYLVATNNLHQDLIIGVSPDSPPNEVPEPATFALFGLGIAGLIGLQGKRRKEK